MAETESNENISMWVVIPSKLRTGSQKRFRRFMDKLKQGEFGRAVFEASNQPPPGTILKVGDEPKDVQSVLPEVPKVDQ